MLFVLHCLDKSNAHELRTTNRPAHLEFARAQTSIKMAGPLLSNSGLAADTGDMVGSMFVIEAADLNAARAFNAADPYTKAGLWASVAINPFRWLLPEGAAH